MRFVASDETTRLILGMVQERFPFATGAIAQVPEFITRAYADGLRLAHNSAGPHPVPSDGSWWVYNTTDAQEVLARKAASVGLPRIYADMALAHCVPLFYGQGYVLLAPNPARR